MYIEEIQNICKKFPGTSEDIKWENHLCFCVGEKMFCVTGLDETPVTASFKCSEEDFDLLSVRKGFKPAPYLARNKWIAIDDISFMNKKEWENYLRKSYELVKAKLPKRDQLLIENGIYDRIKGIKRK